MYGLIVNNVLKQKQEDGANGFVIIPDDAVCGQVTSDGGKTFVNPVPTNAQVIEQHNKPILAEMDVLDKKRIRPLAEGDAV